MEMRYNNKLMRYFEITLILFCVIIGILEKEIMMIIPVALSSIALYLNGKNKVLEQLEALSNK